MSKQFDYSKHLSMVHIVEEYVYLLAYLGMAVGFGSSSSINGLDETLGCKSLLLSYVRSIKDGELRFSTSRVKKKHHAIVSVRLKCRHAFIEVHRVYLISVVITLHMNG